MHLTLQRMKACTLMCLVNLAYPEWITVNCDKRHYTHIVCMKNNKIIASVQNIPYHPIDYYCANQHIMEDQYCYNFVYYDVKDLKLLTLGSFLSAKYFSKLEFVILAVKTFPNILFVEKN